MRSFYFAIPAMLLLLAGKSTFAQCGSADLAAGKPATASSFDNNLFGFLGPQPPANVFDGSNTTIWASNGAGTQFIYVDLGSTINVCQVNLTWSILGTGRNFNIATSNDASTWTQRTAITNNTATTNTIPLTGSGRYVRLQITTGNGTQYILATMQVMGVTGCSSTDAAQGKTATASNSRPGFPASAAVDGNANTAWRSPASDNQTLTVDMGTLQNICSVALTFDPADYGVNYTIQFSPDNTTYTTAATVTGNNALTNNLVTTGAARFVRFAGTTSAAGNGYAIDEISVSNPIVTLPIRLLSFTATNIGNDQVQLKWSTEMESNNKVFLIERSADGQTYTTIGQVAGAINSNTQLNYDWTDAAPLKGTNYYRLQQVDLDGNSSFSNVAVVNLNSAATLSAYPNPVRDILTILNPKGLTVREVAVYNTSGVVLAKTAPSSTGTVQLSTSTWATGLYLVKVVTNEGTQVIKVMK